MISNLFKLYLLACVPKHVLVSVEIIWFRLGIFCLCQNDNWNQINNTVEEYKSDRGSMGTKLRKVYSIKPANAVETIINVADCWSDEEDMHEHYSNNQLWIPILNDCVGNSVTICKSGFAFCLAIWNEDERSSLYQRQVSWQM